MNDREIAGAAMRWYKANTARLIVSAAKRREEQYSRLIRGYPIASTAIDKSHTEAKRLERSALRALAKVCARFQACQQEATDVIEILPKLTHDKSI